MEKDYPMEKGYPMEKDYPRGKDQETREKDYPKEKELAKGITRAKEEWRICFQTFATASTILKEEPEKEHPNLHRNINPSRSQNRSQKEKIRCTIVTNQRIES